MYLVNDFILIIEDYKYILIKLQCIRCSRSYLPCEPPPPLAPPPYMHGACRLHGHSLEVPDTEDTADSCSASPVLDSPLSQSPRPGSRDLHHPRCDPECRACPPSLPR